MKKIRTKITLPFLYVIIIISIITLILFNIALRTYFTRTAIQDLRNTVSTVRILIRNQIGENLINEKLNNNESRILTTLGNLRTILKVSKLSANTEFIIFSRDLEVIYPLNLKSEETFIDENLISQLRNILPTAEKNKVYTIKSGRDRYLAVSNQLMQIALPRTPYLVFVSSLSNGRGVMRALNFILVLILLIAVFVGCLFALSVSKSISKPIVTLSGYAKKIGQGEFIKVPLDNSSQEIYDLSKNMNEMSMKLLNSTNAQKTFLQNASHELRTPLMSIQGYAEGIIKGVFPDVEKAAGIICDESKRLNNLVEELLILSHIENETYTNERAKLNLSHMIKEYIQRVRGLALKENKEIITNIEDESIFVFADDKLLSRAIINVISNCIRYARSAVTVKVCKRGNSAVITIKDDGNGINEEDLPHIFERFYKGKKGNFGLGLSIAKLAVEHSGGSITAQNTESGAQFEIVLPILTS